MIFIFIFFEEVGLRMFEEPHVLGVYELPPEEADAQEEEKTPMPERRVSWQNCPEFDGFRAETAAMMNV